MPKTRDSIFGSANERDLYQSLCSRWNDRFEVYPNIPFAQIIDLATVDVNNGERAFLLKTSVDYTVCRRSDGKPLMSIEFDGLGHGFSRDGQYVQKFPTRDQHRKLKLDLKLRVAITCGFPLVVVSYDEKATLGPDLSLTIVNGLIGRVLAEKWHAATLERDYERVRDYIEELPPDERHEAVTDFIDGHRIESEFRWDPLEQKAVELERQLDGGVGWRTYSPERLYDPDIQCLGGSPADFVESLRTADRVGCKLTVGVSAGEFSETVWMRNLFAFNIRCEDIVENVARIVLAQRLVAAAAAI